MTTKAYQFAIDGTAIKVVGSDNQYQEVLIHSTDKVWIGDSDAVSTTNGFLVDVGSEIKFRVAPYSEIWAISNGGTTKTAYLLITVV